MENFSQIIANIKDRKIAFLITFFVIFTFSYAILYALDFYPEPAKSEAKEVTSPITPAQTDVIKTPVIAPVASTSVVTHAAQTGATLPINAILPIKMVIPTLNKTVTVLNPAGSSVSALDTALLSSVARHPESATLGENGNIFIMGHSSYLPVVHNHNYQALNGIQNLKWGDTISLFSSDTEYVYRVEKVYKAKASTLTVPVGGPDKTLTLATCNSFGTKDDRFIVEATLISTKASN
jgi:LPXTG-site transpeptidase (sortase) family protein